MIRLNYVDKKNVGEYVYHTIRQRIIDWELKPGQQMSEQLIAEEINVSRTPVREAFIKLIGENLLEARPYIGTFVTLIDVDQVTEARFIRESLESSVAELACNLDVEDYIKFATDNIKKQEKYIKSGDMVSFIECDDAFHKELYIACNKEMTWDVVAATNSQYSRLRLLCLFDNNGDLLVEEHKSILRAIGQKNQIEARVAVERHLQKILYEIDLVRKRHPEYFKEQKFYSL